MDLRELSKRGETSEIRHPWEQARLQVVLQLMKENIKNLNNTTLNILDMGCGDTYFVEQLSRELPSCNYYAIDIAFEEEQLALLQEKFQGTNIKVYKEFNDATNDISGKIDIVLLLDVIEHIENDIEFLKWMKTFDCIQKSTNFFITVPAFQSLFCAHDEFLGHFRRYTNTSLKQHITHAGFKTNKLGYFFTSLLLPRWIQVQKEKNPANKPDFSTGLVDWNGSAGKTKLITSILIIDFKIGHFFKKLGLNIAGLSNYTVCTPTA